MKKKKYLTEWSIKWTTTNPIPINDEKERSKKVKKISGSNRLQQKHTRKKKDV